jgi:hypothetical protein
MSQENSGIVLGRSAVRSLDAGGMIFEVTDG